MEDIARRWCAIGVATVIALIAPPVPVQTQAPSALADLTTLFAPGAVLQDRNGHGVIDFVNARIVLGEQPSAADVLAADVAARFGFETMAMNLPLSSADSTGSGRDAGGTPAFVIGTDGARRIGAALPIAMTTLRPGDGTIVTTTARGAPAVMVLGADAAGTMAQSSSQGVFRTCGTPRDRRSLRSSTT